MLTDSDSVFLSNKLDNVVHTAVQTYIKTTAFQDTRISAHKSLKIFRDPETCHCSEIQYGSQRYLLFKYSSSNKLSCASIFAFV